LLAKGLDALTSTTSSVGVIREVTAVFSFIRACAVIFERVTCSPLTEVAT
jgi:hypothetical protein